MRATNNFKNSKYSELYNFTVFNVYLFIKYRATSSIVPTIKLYSLIFYVIYYYNRSMCLSWTAIKGTILIYIALSSV